MDIHKLHHSSFRDLFSDYHNSIWLRRYRQFKYASMYNKIRDYHTAGLLSLVLKTAGYCYVILARHVMRSANQMALYADGLLGRDIMVGDKLVTLICLASKDC